MKGFPHLCPTATWRRQTGGTQHDQQGDQAPRWESIDVARVWCDRAGCWRMTESREKRVRRQGDAAGRTATGHFTGHESHSHTQRARQTAERLMSGDWEVHATAPRTGWAVTHTSHIDHIVIEDTRDRAHLGFWTDRAAKRLSRFRVNHVFT